MDGHVPDERDEGGGDEEVIQSPTDIVVAGIHQGGPPGVFDPLRVKGAVDINQTVGEIGIDPGALLGEKAGGVFVCLGVSQINLLVRRVEITTDDQVFTGSMQLVNQ